MSKTSIFLYISIGLALGSVITKYRIEAQLEEYAAEVKKGMATVYHAGRKSGAIDCAKDGFAIIVPTDGKTTTQRDSLIICNGDTYEQPQKNTIPEQEDSVRNFSI